VAVLVGIIAAFWCAVPARADEALPSESAVTASVSDRSSEVVVGESSDTTEDDLWVRPAFWLQPQPLLIPSQERMPEMPLPAGAEDITRRLFASDQPGLAALSRSRRAAIARSGVERILGVESRFRATTDAGALLGKSPSILGVKTQHRSPIVSDPRIRGSRVGSLAASGSYWVPARIDLDTMLNKIDSRILADAIVIKGPYSVRYGPGFDFVDVQLLPAPRFLSGFESHASIASDYHTNGQQLYGRQQVWGGSPSWGYRVGYGHRTGNDYRAGTGEEFPASYNSRDVDVALGGDLSPESSWEFNYLRLDQTNVEFPGQAYDIDVLMTDGFDVAYEVRNQAAYDRYQFNTWYNRTRFDGSAQREGKRRQFPFYDLINYAGVTDVDSMSTGFRSEIAWGQEEEPQVTAGVDFRLVKQELNEISSGSFGFARWQDANSPIPRSYSANPGVFLDCLVPLSDRLVVSAGIRGDTVSTDVTDDPAKLAALGADTPQSSLADILGTDQFKQDFATWSAFFTSDYEVNACWNATLGFGFAQRPPNLTELYAADPFMFLIQNGLNTVVGDPRLAPERLWQLDLGLKFDNGRLRSGLHGFHGWSRDYITLENTRVFRGPTGLVEQVNLKYVNTDLATLAGGEWFAEFDANDWMVPFVTVQYVEGRDHTRDGDFATRRASGNNPSVRVYGLDRGYFSGVVAAGQEPLPGIAPLESRAGVRLHDPGTERRWLVEISARTVSGQERVATSLLESPTPGFTVGDVRAYWQASEPLQLFAGVENFTDRSYREHLDFRSENGIQILAPGVSFYFGGEWTR
jgi:outer membrane receptor protein involved in Fe transport